MKVKITNYYWSPIDKKNIGREIEVGCELIKENSATVVVKVPRLDGRILTVKRHKIVYE